MFFFRHFASECSHCVIITRSKRDGTVLWVLSVLLFNYTRVLCTKYNPFPELYTFCPASRFTRSTGQTYPTLQSYFGILYDPAKQPHLTIIKTVTIPKYFMCFFYQT